MYQVLARDLERSRVAEEYVVLIRSVRRVTFVLLAFLAEWLVFILQ